MYTNRIVPISYDRRVRRIVGGPNTGRNRCIRDDSRIGVVHLSIYMFRVRDSDDRRTQPSLTRAQRPILESTLLLRTEVCPPRRSRFV